MAIFRIWTVMWAVLEAPTVSERAISQDFTGASIHPCLGPAAGPWTCIGSDNDDLYCPYWYGSLSAKATFKMNDQTVQVSIR